MVMREFGGITLSEFDDRLILQKRIYVLQSFGLDLDYRYNWYVRGPYCPQLTEDAYEAIGRREDLQIQSESFTLTEDSKKTVNDYKTFEAGLDRHNLPIMLELAASIHYFLHVGFLFGGKTYENIKLALRQRGKQFTDEQYQAVWSALDACGLIAKKSLA